MATYEDVYQAARYVLMEKMVVGFMDDMEYSCQVDNENICSIFQYINTYDPMFTYFVSFSFVFLFFAH